MDGGFTRRTVLAGAAMALAAPVLAKEHEHGAAGHAQPKGYAELIAAARECREAGEVCLDHCLAAFRDGDTSLGECATEVTRMLAACDAVARLATYGSPHTPAFAKACVAVCDDCERACRKHEEKHAECKACADACARFRKSAAGLGA